MSLIDLFKDDLGSLSDFLKEWMRDSGATAGNLDHEASQTEAAHGELDQALNNATGRAASLQQAGQELRKASTQLGSQLTETSNSLKTALEAAAQSCESRQQEVSRSAHEMGGAAATSGTLLEARHEAVGVSFQNSSTARAHYSENTQRHHSTAHQFLSDTQTQVKTNYGKFEVGAQSASSQLNTLTGELGQHLTGKVAPTSKISSDFLANELKTSLETMVRERLQSTLTDLKGYQGKVQHVGGELASAGLAAQTIVQELTGAFPGKVMSRVGDPILSRAWDLGVNQVVTLGETIAGASISASVAGAFPVLKVVERSLALLLNVVNLSQTGQLLSDDPSEYENIEETRERLKGAGGSGQSVNPGLTGLIDQQIMQLDGVLVGVGMAAAQAKGMVDHVAQQGLQAGQQFLEAILCPSCKTECVVAE